MAPNLRKQDANEIMASSGKEPFDALWESYDKSVECFTIIHEDGDVVGMFGVSYCGHFASPWLLGTDKLTETKRVMLPVAAKWVEEKVDQYSLLLNYVDADNTVSMKWLKSLGFKFIKLLDYGVGQKPFYQFVRIKDV
jgi:hypothetical protein|tara:strand:+ start:8738 stop:9151 length:414 start_codon:yes stop_codon:yes gene_type:complete